MCLFGRFRKKFRNILQTSLHLYSFTGTAVRPCQDLRIRFAVDKTLRTERLNCLCHTISFWNPIKCAVKRKRLKKKKIVLGRFQIIGAIGVRYVSRRIGVHIFCCDQQVYCPYSLNTFLILKQHNNTCLTYLNIN